MDYLEIKYYNGKMTINMDEFFPTSQVRLKKLLKVINLDYGNSMLHVSQIITFLNDKSIELETKKSIVGKKALEYRQKVADTQRIVESKKKPSGVRLTEEELKSAREDLQHFKNVCAALMSDFNKSITLKERILKNKEFLEKLI